jgi:hypothetical protein
MCAGVSDVFAFIAQRIVTRWEWEETRAEPRGAVSSTVGLDQTMITQKKYLLFFVRVGEILF